MGVCLAGLRISKEVIVARAKGRVRFRYERGLVL